MSVDFKFQIAFLFRASEWFEVAPLALAPLPLAPALVVAPVGWVVLAQAMSGRAAALALESGNAMKCLDIGWTQRNGQEQK